MKTKTCIAFLVNLVLSVFAAIFFELQAAEIGLIVGTATALFICGFRRCIPILDVLIQSIVLGLLILRLDWWTVYVGFISLNVFVRIVFNIVPKGDYLPFVYFAGCVIPGIFTLWFHSIAKILG